jgi:hypothetical protein
MRTNRMPKNNTYFIGRGKSLGFPYDVLIKKLITKINQKYFIHKIPRTN